MSVPTVALESPSGPGGSDMFSMDEQHQGLLGTAAQGNAWPTQDEGISA